MPPEEMRVADFSAMRQRAVLVLCGALMVAAWGIFARVLASAGGPVDEARTVTFLCDLVLAAALTLWGAELVVREWRGTVGRVAAAPISGLAILATLWLSLTSEALPLWVLGLVLVGVMPFGFGFGATVLAHDRWPMSKRRTRLVGAGLAVCFALILSLGSNIAGAVALAVISYIPWLVGARAGAWFERKYMRSRSDLSERGGLLS
jgi:hypothetical protein